MNNRAGEIDFLTKVFDLWIRKKKVSLQGYGLEVVERVAIQSEPTCDNINYLKTKQEKLGHLLANL